MPHTIEEIAAAIGADFTGDGALPIARLAPPEAAGDAGDLALAMTPKAVRALPKASCRAVIVAAGEAADLSKFDTVITTASPRQTLARLSAMFETPPDAPPGIHPTAIIDATAVVGESARIGAYSIVGAATVIGDGVTVLPHVTIGAGVSVGAGSLIYPGVRIGDRCSVGARAILHNNASIGADGFGFAMTETDATDSVGQNEVENASSGAMLRIASLGNVEIGDDVEIGANACVDRGTLGPTVIGAGTKIDNLVQIGHNVRIGSNARICGQVGVSGSTVVGDRTVIGGGAGLADNLRIGEDSLIMASAGVATNIPARTIYGGTPAVPRHRFVDQVMRIGRLRFLFDEVKSLKERLEKIEKPSGGQPGGD
ncbi:MAG: UDP-3-O-(3-hydroxymyristoyl)glucosamine N-acyltransferase [Flavobacteriaceae bacterium]